jgi:CelD/BcsL family acetyltransferase involved in cellulose biosynthesis
MTHRIVITHDRGELDRLRILWTHVHNRSANESIFMTWEWVNTWWTHFGEDHKLWILLAYDNLRLVGIAPLMEVGRRPENYSAQFATRFRELRFIGGTADYDHLDFLVERGAEERVIPAFLNALLERKTQWDILHLSNIPSSSKTLEILRNFPASWEETDRSLCPVVNLPSDWEVFLQSLSSGKRKEQRRFQRQLDAAYPGRWTMRTVKSAADLPGTLDNLFTLHERKWEAHGKQGAFGTPREQAFHRAIARDFLASGWLRLHRLEIDAKVAATIYSFQYRGRSYDFASGMNFSVESLSPGQVLTEFALREAIQDGVREYDFLRGSEEYKFRWGALPHGDISLRWVMSRRAQIEQGLIRILREFWLGIKTCLPNTWRRRLIALFKQRY